MRNKWKTLFLILLGLNIIVCTVIYAYITVPVEKNSANKEEMPLEGAPFKIEINKQDLNHVINHYLQDQVKGPIEYQIILDENVNLYGTFPIFNNDVEMKVAFEPKALENGDLLLQEKSLSIGKLKLPASTVLKFVNDQYEFPDWVTIQPGEENVYMDFQKLKLKSDLKVRVNEFDLNRDQISFTLLVPLKKGVSP